MESKKENDKRREGHRKQRWESIEEKMKVINPNALKVVSKSPRKVYPHMNPLVWAQKFEVVRKSQ